MKSTKEINQQLSNIEDAKVALESFKDDQQNSFDEKSDKWKEGEKGQEAEADLESLQEAIENLEEAIEKLEEIFQK